MTRTLTVGAVVLSALWCAGCEGRGSAEEPTDTGAAMPGGAAAARPGARAAAGLVPLAISLPKPMFKCTPYPIHARGIPNLEDRSKRRRPRGPFLVPPGTTNIALGKPITSSDLVPIIGELEQIVDGQKQGTDGYFVELWSKCSRNGELLPAWVQIDLQCDASVYAILIWRRQWANVYHDVVVRISHDPDFIDAVTIFNNDHDNTCGFGIGRDKAYVESYQGKLIDCKGFTGRYVRLYSRGSLRDEGNYYTEVEVHGRAVDAPPAPIDQPLPKLETSTPRRSYTCGEGYIVD